MHLLFLVNYTQDVLLVLPNNGALFEIPSQSTISLSLQKLKTLGSMQLKNATDTSQPMVNLNIQPNWNARRFGWEFISDTRSRYNVFRIILTKKKQTFIIFPKRKLSSFLADMPSALPLSSLMLPGTHDSVAFYGWPLSQCQESNTPLPVQFAAGIRIIDVRLAIINGVLISYHGVYPQRLPFLVILQQVQAFLSSPKGRSETIIMSIKQEDRASLLFSQLVHESVFNGPGGRDMWFLENRIPTLGEVRGKVVMLSRFGGDGEGWEGGLEGMGIHPSTWPDSKEDGFEWWLKGTKVRTQDWYAIPSFLSIPEKAEKASRILLQPNPPPLFPVLSISFLSAASFPMALPHVVACGFGMPSWRLGVEGVNSRLTKWILSAFAGDNASLSLEGATDKQKSMSSSSQDLLATVEPRLRGWCMMDFFMHPAELGLVSLLVECNYRSRRPGEEGWP